MAWAAALGCMLALACGAPSRAGFATPEDAVKALIEAAQKNNLEAFKAVLGPNAAEVLDSGDPVADRQNREVILAAFQQGWALVDRDGNTKEIEIGDERWPFPIPIVKDEAGWHFDLEAGKEEILGRRIGRNELMVIEICRTYVQAQAAYANRARNGQPVGAFAQKFISSPGKQDGLYWPANKGEGYSPLGELFAQASAEGFLQNSGGKPQPFHGYFFRILTAQGPSAPGGAKGYIENGVMTGGFAMVAWPAQYAKSGVMTFIVARDGIVYENDLGPETEALVKAMNVYDPGAGWEKTD
jgi:hypothetical protein